MQRRSERRPADTKAQQEPHSPWSWIGPRHSGRLSCQLKLAGNSSSSASAYSGVPCFFSKCSFFFCSSPKLLATCMNISWAPLAIVFKKAVGMIEGLLPRLPILFLIDSGVLSLIWFSSTALGFHESVFCLISSMSYSRTGWSFEFEAAAKAARTRSTVSFLHISAIKSN